MTCLVPDPEAEHLRGESRMVQKRSVTERFDQFVKGPFEKSIGSHIVQWFEGVFNKGNKQQEGLDLGIAPLDAMEDRNKSKARSNSESSSEDLDGYCGLEQDDQQDLIVFTTKKPTWNKRLGAWTLNFSGRAKIPSKKNFLLVSSPMHDSVLSQEEQDTVYLRFGKLKKHRFNLDFRRPLSPMVALAIACSNFRKKILVT